MFWRENDSRIFVLLDGGAVLAHQRLNLHLVEAATCEDEKVARPSCGVDSWCDRKNDAVDIGFDVDSGLILELFPTVLLRRHQSADPLPEFGPHDFAHIGKGDQRCIVGHELELIGPAGSCQGARGESYVVGQQTRAQANGKDEERTEFAGKSEEAWRGRDRVTPTTGTTVAAWKQGGPATGRLPLIDGLPVYKPLNQGLAAYDMNTGEKLWDVPVGQTPERFKNHPLLKGVDVPNSGGTGNSIQMVMGDLLVQTAEDLRGDAEVSAKGKPLLNARDKKTGRVLTSIELPIPGEYGMMTFMHGGKQYILVAVSQSGVDAGAELIA